MMKSRNQIFISATLVFLILGIALFTFFTRDQEPLQTFPATISNDCAPWDGAAFTVLVQYDSMTVIYISIWQSPIINSPNTFSVRNDLEQDGNAYIIAELDPYIMLNGKVSFQSVKAGMPVEGSFKLTSESGEQYEGQFIAAWQNGDVLCG